MMHVQTNIKLVESVLTRCLSRNTLLPPCQYLSSNAPVSSIHLSPAPYNLRHVERRHINTWR